VPTIDNLKILTVLIGFFELPSGMASRQTSCRKRRYRHETTELEMPTDGALRLVIVADTHSKPHPDAVDLIAGQAPDAILHAGDIGAARVIDDLAELAPVIAVRGNIDDVGRFPDSIDIGVMSAGVQRLRLLLVHIAVAGPRLRADAARSARDHGAKLVVCGHSHVPFMGEDRGLTVFNPGSIGPRRFTLPIVFGVMTLTGSGIQLEHISCETGQRWLP